MLVISSREFRQNQRLYFDKVDAGEQVIVQRGKNKSYILRSVGSDDLYFSADMVQKIKDSLRQAKEGNTFRISSEEDIDDLLDL